MAEKTLDIFALLAQLDKKNINVWNSLTENQQKEVSPFMILRWLAGTTDPRQIIFLNELLNVMVFSLGDHKELLLKLATVCTSGQTRRYSWVKYKITSGKKQKKSVELISQFHNCSLREAEDTIRLYSKEEILELAESSGMQKEEINEVKKELT